MRVLALDQASRTSGWAVFDEGKLVTYGKFTADQADVGDRLHFIRMRVSWLIDDYDIDEVVFEDIQLQDMAGGKEVGIKTFKILAEVFGVIYELLTEMKIKNAAVAPIVWKATFKIAGKGRSQEMKMAKAHIQSTFGLAWTEDEADAACIGLHYLKKQTAEFDWS